MELLPKLFDLSGLNREERLGASELSALHVPVWVFHSVLCFPLTCKCGKNSRFNLNIVQRNEPENLEYVLSVLRAIGDLSMCVTLKIYYPYCDT